MTVEIMPGMIFVEAPEGATNIGLSETDNGEHSLWYTIDGVGDCISLPPGNWAYLFCTADASEEQAKSVVDSWDSRSMFGDLTELYEDYSRLNDFFYTAKESLQSLLKSVGLDPKGNYPVLKKIN